MSSTFHSTKPAETDDAPPAYTVSQATEMMGGSAGPGGSLGFEMDSKAQQGLKKRAVPKTPVVKE